MGTIQMFISFANQNLAVLCVKRPWNVRETDVILCHFRTNFGVIRCLYFRTVSSSSISTFKMIKIWKDKSQNSCFNWSIWLYQRCFFSKGEVCSICRRDPANRIKKKFKSKWNVIQISEEGLWFAFYRSPEMIKK